MRYLLFIVLILFASCEDPVPFDYEPENVVEAFIVVGETIQDIRIMKSQNLSQNFDFESSIIRDANVRIFNNDIDLKLKIDAEGEKGYYDDSGYLIEASTKYNLEITLSDGSKITGSTTTPINSSWITESPDFVQYPKDTINLPNTLSLTWEKNLSFDFYHLQVVALDTLEYGKYLSPQTEELNSRIYRSFAEDNDEYYRETSSNAFIPNTTTPVVWNTFKFYGLHEVVIYTPDDNWTRWFLQYVATPEYNELLSSVEGNGFGAFASAGAIRDTFFLLKN